MSYYYLVAGLPMLVLGQPPAITPGDFRERCREHLSAADNAVLEDLLGAGLPRGGHAFTQAWRERETRLRNAVVRVRAMRAGRDPGAHLRPERGFDVYTLKAVDDAFARATPAERELELDRFRWTVLDELGGRDGFTTEAVLVYALKLRIAARWAALDERTGRRVAEELIESQAAVPL